MGDWKEVLGEWLAFASSRGERSDVDLVVCAAPPGDAVSDLITGVESVARRVAPAMKKTLLMPDAPADVALCRGWSVKGFNQLEWIRLESPFCDDGVAVPIDWIQETPWVTIVSLEGQGALGLRTPLTLHAELLAAGNPSVPWPSLACEAYRLGQADVSVAHIPVCSAEHTGSLVLLDTRLERMETTLAWLTGVDIAEFPHWGKVTSHFHVDPELSPEVLSSGVKARIDLHLDAARESAALAERHHRRQRRWQDVSRCIRNLRRVPAFVRRRLPTLRGGFR